MTSLFLVVARAHMTRSHASANQPDPINLHLEFLRRTSADADAVFRVRELKVGSRISNLHVTLSQKSGGEGKEEVWRDNVEGYVTMSNLARESGLTLPTSLTLYPPPPGPANLELLARESRDDHYVLQPPFAFRAAQHIRVYLPRADKQAKGRAKKSYVDQWVRFWPEGREGRWTNDALGYVVDMFPQIVEEYLLPREEESSAGAASSRTVTQRRPQANFWYPTLSLNLDVRRALPEEGVEWLFVRVGSRVIRNGRMDLEVLVLDEAGEVVATSTHQGLIVGTERNVAGRKYKQEKEGRSKL